MRLLRQTSKRNKTVPVLGRFRKKKHKQHQVAVVELTGMECDQVPEHKENGPEELLSQQVFLALFDEIQLSLNKMRKATLSISQLTDHMVYESVSRTSSVGVITDSINRLARETKTMLRVLQQAATAADVKKRLGEAEARMRQNLLRLATKEFQEVIQSYQAAQEVHKAEVQRKLERHVKILRPDATDEEVESAIREKGGLDQLFQQQILNGGKEIQLVQEKHRDIVRLEASVAELHGMFLDLALLTEQQGELLNQIEHNVQQAEEVVEVGNDELGKAIESQRSIRKKQLWIIAIVVVATVVVVVILL